MTASGRRAVVAALYYTHKPGGFCPRLYRLLVAVARRGARVEYHTLDVPPSPLPGVDVRLIPYPSARRTGTVFWGTFTAWAPLYALLRAASLRPACVAAFNPYYAAVWAPARCLTGARTVLFVRGRVEEVDRLDGKPWPLRVASAAVNRIGFAASDLVVFLTEHERSSAVASGLVASRRTAVLPNDIPHVPVGDPGPPTARRDESRAAPPGREAPLTVLWAGTLTPGKNVSILVRAVRSVPDLPLAVDVAGEGRERERAEREAAGDPRLRFLGWRDDLRLRLPRYHLFVHTSVSEGMPNAVLEALGAGVAVAAADVPPVRELLGDDLLLFDPADPAALAAVLVRAATDPGYLGSLRRASAAAADRFRFDWDRAASDVVLGAAAGGRPDTLSMDS